MHEYLIVVFWSEEDHAWIADVPDLRSCTAHGRTPEKAVAEVRIAMEAWLETAREAGKPLPVPRASVGENPIRLFRDLAGMTQPELADRSGLNQRVISRLELGQRKPTVDHLIALSNVLGVPPDRLYPPLAAAGGKRKGVSSNLEKKGRQKGRIRSRSPGR